MAGEFSTLCAAGVSTLNQEQFWGVGGYVSADTIGNTTLLCGRPYKYLGSIQGDETNVNTNTAATLVFSGGRDNGHGLALPLMPWMTARAAGGRLFALCGWTLANGYTSYLVSVITGYVPNNADCTIMNDGNVFTFTMPFAARWTDIAYGNGMWLAVAGVEGSSTSARYATSTDNGQTWTTRTFADATAGTHCVFIGGYFVRPGYKSTDGINWTSSTAPAAPYRVSGGVVFSDTHYSSNGTTWTAHTNANITHNVAYVEGRHGGVWVASVYSKYIDNATHYGNLFYSTDGGGSWGIASRSPYGYAAITGGGVIFACGEYAITTGADYSYYDPYAGLPMLYPQSWRSQLDSATATDTWCLGRALATAAFISLVEGSAVAEASLFTQQELIADLYRPYSVQLLERWKPVPTTPVFNKLYSAGGKVMYDSGSTTRYVGGSLSDPASLVTMFALTIANPYHLPVMTSRFVGWTGTTIYYSTDGNTWTLAYTHSVTISKVVYVNGEYVAYSFTSSAAARSSDGVTWTAVTLANSNCVTLHHCEDHYYFSCGSGTSYTLQVTTTNSLTAGTTSIWSLTNLKVGGVWRCQSDGYLYILFITSSTEIYNYTYRALTVYDTFVQVLQSIDGVNGTPPGLPPFHDTGQGVFVTWGNSPAKFYYSENGLNWTSGPTLGASFIGTDSQGRVSPSGALVFNRGSGEMGELRVARYAKAWGALTNYTDGATALRGGAYCADAVLTGVMNPDFRLGDVDCRAIASVDASMDTVARFSAGVFAEATADADLTAPKVVFFDAAPYGRADAVADLTAPQTHHFEATSMALAFADADLTAPKIVFFDATCAGVGTASGVFTIHPAIYLDCLGESEASLSAQLRTVIRLAATSSVSSELLGEFITATLLRSACGGISVLAGQLNTAVLMAVVTRAQATAYAGLRSDTEVESVAVSTDCELMRVVETTPTFVVRGQYIQA